MSPVGMGPTVDWVLLPLTSWRILEGGWQSMYVLVFGDAQFYDENEESCKVRHATMVGIVLRGGKNYQFRRNEIKHQFATGDPLLCPVRGFAWIRIANRIHKTQPWEPIARVGPNRGVENGHIIQLSKEVATALGLNAANYSTHSIRLGVSTALLNSGVNPLVIKLLGRWLSDCYQSYPVLTSKGTVGGFEAHVLTSG
jgi:hypothetical protein